MPTGYTAGLLDGTINTFPDFAKLCMRNFGATIHMRDENMDTEYEPRTPSDYHSNALSEARRELENAESVSDEELIKARKKELLKSKKYHLAQIEENDANKIKLEGLIKDIEAWAPPTEEHNGIKQFMIQQIESTLDYDCSTDYHKKELQYIKQKLDNVNANVIRADIVETANKDIAYHLKEYKEELKRCAGANQWVEDLMNSLPKTIRAKSQKS